MELEDWSALAEGLGDNPGEGVVLLRAVPDGSGGTDFLHEYANGATERVMRQGPLAGVPLSAVLPTGSGPLLAALRQLQLTGGRWEGELPWPSSADPSGSPGTWAVVCVAVGRERYACQYRDVSPQREALRALAHDALHDALTGLANRRLFEERVGRARARLARHRAPLALVLCDLDGFKEVNDRLGHAAGDALLQEVSRRMEAALRPEDTVARFGGDEFVLLLEDLPDTVVAPVRAAERVRAAVGGEYVLEGRAVHLTLSLGVVTTSSPLPAEELLRMADTALYEAKRRGRDRTEVFSPRLREHASLRADVADELRRALAHGELVVHYQPKTELATGRIAGVEALVRWEHPQRGLLLPEDFLEAALDSGLILPLGAFVLDRACRDVQGWRGGEGVRLQVNTSAEEVLHPGLVGAVSSALSGSGLDPGRLELEVTETRAFADVDAAAHQLDQVAALGVTFALDDFGTGASSLAWLQRFPVSCVKIDQSFVRHLATSSTDAAIAAAVVTLGHALGLQVVAEGIEDARQLELVTALDVDLGQGFYLGRPASSAETEALLLAR
ncbi:diguanylate cyclase (GGDEF)-like protein [Motilibacter rhizosphaerae]|uniref:Diguanylate cyclase (GGDEF)-like protein n=1 Tax=Motilibacter rhizosphaerae TaxID=598652 RepID=A0A4Q7N7J6_9ACTN|nr:bifunctional diguanylate cyclase/phosphodiesterase [Motilibacter rhizosphaerae]RZS77914.1 diguanylate cyclase (GGDEF)-like protein [Motilibacter rhizosphaerae]